MDNSDPRAWLARPLRAFYEGPFTARFCANVDRRTRADIVSTLNHFERVVADRPALGSIDDGHLARLRDGLKGKLAAATVNKHLGNVSWLLSAAGPRDNRHPGALELLQRVPWVQSLHVDERSIRSVSDDELVAWWEAADAAVRPKHDGVKPGDWWRALAATALTAILRRGALLNKLRWSKIDRYERWITVEGASDKVGRVRHKRLHEFALACLLKIRTADDVVFRWPFTDTEYYRQWARIEKRSGTDFGLHDLKRTALSRLARVVDAATLQKLGDHSSLSTTLRYYVNVPDERTAAAVDGINLPLAELGGSTNARTDSQLPRRGFLA